MANSLNKSYERDLQRKFNPISFDIRIRCGIRVDWQKVVFLTSNSSDGKSTKIK